jgi:hypothetical protein
MRFHLTTDDGSTVTIDVQPGDNVWITMDGDTDPIGSLYLSREADTIGLGTYDHEVAGWEYAETIPVTVA